MEPIDHAFEGAGGSAREEPAGTAIKLGNRGRYAVRDEVEDNAGSIGRHKGDPTGAHDARTCVLFGCEFVGGDIDVTRMAVGERGELRLKLAADGPLEGCVAGKVEGVELDEYLEPVDGDIALHGPDVSLPFLVIPSGDSEK